MNIRESVTDHVHDYTRQDMSYSGRTLIRTQTCPSGHRDCQYYTVSGRYYNPANENKQTDYIKRQFTNIRDVRHRHDYEKITSYTGVTDVLGGIKTCPLFHPLCWNDRNYAGGMFLTSHTITDTQSGDPSWTLTNLGIRRVGSRSHTHMLTNNSLPMTPVTITNATLASCGLHSNCALVSGTFSYPSASTATGQTSENADNANG